MIVWSLPKKRGSWATNSLRLLSDVVNHRHLIGLCRASSPYSPTGKFLHSNVAAPRQQLIIQRNDGRKELISVTLAVFPFGWVVGWPFKASNQLITATNWIEVFDFGTACFMISQFAELFSSNRVDSFYLLCSPRLERMKSRWPNLTRQVSRFRMVFCWLVRDVILIYRCLRTANFISIDCFFVCAPLNLPSHLCH